MTLKLDNLGEFHKGIVYKDVSKVWRNYDG